MISTPDRQKAVALIEEACASGARLEQACVEMGLSARTYARWKSGEEIRADARPTALRPAPSQKLTEAERAQLIEVANRPEYASLPPSQIVPRLADTGCYLASESTFYRVLKGADQQHHRGRAAKPTSRAPERHCATGANQIWAWDISWLPGPVRGMFFFLYLIVDIYSRKIVGFEVHTEENAAHAATLVRQATLREQTLGKALVLHADNGAPMKGASLLATLQMLGVIPSYSRPSVSDDNAYAEALFRTCKYRPDYPVRGFATLEQARAWVQAFVRWYNHEHRHSGLAFVTPCERHEGRAAAILAQRRDVYEAARARNPRRWSRHTRRWQIEDEVWLNPPTAEANAFACAA